MGDTGDEEEMGGDFSEKGFRLYEYCRLSCRRCTGFEIADSIFLKNILLTVRYCTKSGMHQILWLI